MADDKTVTMRYDPSKLNAHERRHFDAGHALCEGIQNVIDAHALAGLVRVQELLSALSSVVGLVFVNVVPPEKREQYLATFVKAITVTMEVGEAKAQGMSFEEAAALVTGADATKGKPN